MSLLLKSMVESNNQSEINKILKEITLENTSTQRINTQKKYEFLQDCIRKYGIDSLSILKLFFIIFLIFFFF